jgi:glycosyltransferase involved in cell wall biosynthesis
MPMAIVEALAVGIPVIANDVGDVGEMLRSTGAGIAVPAQDHPAFTAACARMLTDHELRTQTAARARDAGDTFDAAMMSRRYAALLAGAVARRPPAQISLDAELTRPAVNA